MSARARATTCAGTSCCVSRSPSARWPARSTPPSPAPLANRPRPQQARQEADRGEQRPAALPRLQLDVRAGMAVDLPGDVIGAAREGEAGLGEAQDRERLPLDAPPRPIAPASDRRCRGERWPGETAVAVRLQVHDRLRPTLALGAQLG